MNTPKRFKCQLKCHTLTKCQLGGSAKRSVTTPVGLSAKETLRKDGQ